MILPSGKAVAAPMLDPLLRGFIDAPDDAEAEQRLATLLEDEAAPLIRTIAARKLRAYGVGPANAFSPEDLEDVAADAILALLSRLQELRRDPHSDPIESLADYTATVTYNTFAHYLRRRHPARSRLKNRLRYALTTDRRFALWPTPDGLVCGLAVWRGRPASAPAGENLARMAAEPDRWLPSMRTRPEAWADPAPSLGALLLALGGPVEFDRMVGTMAALSSAEGEPKSVDAAVLESLPDESSPRPTWPWTAGGRWSASGRRSRPSRCGSASRSCSACATGRVPRSCGSFR